MNEVKNPFTEQEKEVIRLATIGNKSPSCFDRMKEIIEDEDHERMRYLPFIKDNQLQFNFEGEQNES